MHAVIKTGGKQYRVAANDLLEIEKIPAEVGEHVAFPDVLMVTGEAGTHIGKPMVTGAQVAAEVVEHMRGDKVIIFKKKRRHNYRRKKGHRQELTVVRITEILTGGAAPAKTAKLLDASAPGTGYMPAAKLARRDGSVNKPKVFGLLQAPDGKADDLSLIGGVGPKLHEKLNQAGVWHFWQVAAMSDAEIATVEKGMGFDGRIKREEWREQAKELMAGKPPRAKTDRARRDVEDV
jgi:large subunit ribosomal protein L21